MDCLKYGGFKAGGTVELSHECLHSAASAMVVHASNFSLFTSIGTYSMNALEQKNAREGKLSNS